MCNLCRIDDIEDSSSLRRGEPCAYKKFGIPLTLNSANLTYFEALKLLQSSSKMNFRDISIIFTEEMINLHVGQGTEIYFRDCGNCIPTLEEYFKICSKKTGGLFRLFTRLLLKCSKKSFETETENLIVGLAEDLGKFYQIRDDYLNLFEGDANDLIEGKYTLPTIFADIKEIKCQNSTEIEAILQKLKEVEADKICLRTLTDLAGEMENLIFEIEQRTGRENSLKGIIYSLFESQ